MPGCLYGRTHPALRWQQAGTAGAAADGLGSTGFFSSSTLARLHGHVSESGSKVAMNGLNEPGHIELHTAAYLPFLRVVVASQSLSASVFGVSPRV